VCRKAKSSRLQCRVVRRNISLPSSGWKAKQSKKLTEEYAKLNLLLPTSAALLHGSFTLKTEDISNAPPKRRGVSELHGLKYHNTVLFIVTLIRTPNPTWRINSWTFQGRKIMFRWQSRVWTTRIVIYLTDPARLLLTR
jgi:hypothetical protein